MVTTTEASVPSSASIGVALTSVVTLRPSAVVSTISSARTVSARLSALASGSRSRAISRPSAKRQVRIPSRSSALWPGMRLWSLQNAGGLANGAPTANGQGYTAELGYGFGVRRPWYPYIATDRGGASSQALRFGLNLKRRFRSGGGT